MNCYATLTRIKSRLDITGTSNDADLQMLLDTASRAIDNYTHRFFYVDATTRYFDGQSSPAFLDDILSITTLKTDEDGDATYENSYTATTDYWMYPINKYPKTYAVINSSGSYGGFASGMRHAIEIDGLFGYAESATPYATSGDAVVDAPLTAAAITITVADADNFVAGQVIKVEDEQCYVSAASGTSLTVTRAVNGTEAAEHVVTTVIYIYFYPDPIVEATLIQAMRWWKRRESAFQDAVRFSESMGEIVVYKGLDPDLELMIKSYIKRRV